MALTGGCFHFPLDEADAVEAALARLQDAGRLTYGAHHADHAVMTCVTPNVDNGEHVHFIDGGAGGLYCAAKEFKARRDRQQGAVQD